MKSLFAALWGAVLFINSIPAAAAMPHWDSDMRQTTIGYSDLDLTRAKGVKTLESRVRRAARQVCSEGGTVSLQEKASQRSCEREARDKASGDVASAISDARQRTESSAFVTDGRWKGAPIPDRQ